MPINKNELTKEQIQKAMACESVEELMELAKAEGVELTKVMELAKAEGVELTKEEAEAYMAEMEDVELDSDALKQVAGGLCYSAGLGADQRCNRGGGIAGA